MALFSGIALVLVAMDCSPVWMIAGSVALMWSLTRSDKANNWSRKHVDCRSGPSIAGHYTYGPITAHFRPRQHRLPAGEHRQEMTHRFQTWREISGTARAA